jgi:hypothetical protein
MSAAFKSMSDLLADSEDLLVKIGRSEIPQVRALLEPFRHSLDQLRAQLRERAKQMRKPPVTDSVRTKPREPRVVAAAALLASVAVVWLCNRGERRW